MRMQVHYLEKFTLRQHTPTLCESRLSHPSVLHTHGCQGPTSPRTLGGRLPLPQTWLTPRMQQHPTNPLTQGMPVAINHTPAHARAQLREYPPAARSHFTQPQPRTRWGAVLRLRQPRSAGPTSCIDSQLQPARAGKQLPTEANALSRTDLFAGAFHNVPKHNSQRNSTAEVVFSS